MPGRSSHPWDWPVTLFQGLVRTGPRAPFQPPQLQCLQHTQLPPSPNKLTGVSVACPGSSGTQRAVTWLEERARAPIACLTSGGGGVSGEWQGGGP